jgi:hypothetical protein
MMNTRPDEIDARPCCVVIQRWFAPPWVLMKVFRVECRVQEQHLGGRQRVLHYHQQPEVEYLPRFSPQPISLAY